MNVCTNEKSTPIELTFCLRPRPICALTNTTTESQNCGLILIDEKKSNFKDAFDERDEAMVKV